jgi:hypothetical protein
MFLVRSNVFIDLEDDEITKGFEDLYNLNEITVKDLVLVFSGEIIENLFEFNLIRNIRDYKSFQSKPDNATVMLHDGVYLDAEKVLFSEEGLLSIIKPNFPIVTLSKIKKTLNTLRTTSCFVSNATHPLVHKYKGDYTIDEELFQILLLLGNPYLALRLERLVVDLQENSKKIELQLNKYLKIMYSDVFKGSFIKKLEKANEKSKDGNILDYIVKKSRNLPKKFNPTKITETFNNWFGKFNRFLSMKNDFISINNEFQKVKNFYSGPDQKMSYIDFIVGVTENEDQISSDFKNSLLKIRENLKEIKKSIDFTSEKELKLLNLDLEREIIENEEEEE